METISAVVPVYNSEQTLRELVSRLEAVLKGVSTRYELILVNDGSTDDSWEVVRSLTDENTWIHGIHLMRNYGQHNALLCGIRAAKHDIIVTLDDDLQNPPEEIPRLLEKMKEGYDVVYGTPQVEQHGFWRDVASQVTKIALKSAMGVDIARNVSAFRVFRTSIRDAFRSYRSPLLSIDVLLTWGTTKFSYLLVKHDQRTAGVSNYTIGKLVAHAMNMMTGFSTFPLQIASMIGFAFTLFGIGVLFYVVGRYLIEGGSVPGFPFLAAIIAIFSGAQLFSVGIIGEYIARMHFRMMERPTYTVLRDETDVEHKA